MAYKRGDTWWITIRSPDGPWVKLSTGTRDRRLALAIEAACNRLSVRERRSESILRALCSHELPPYAVYAQGEAALQAKLDDTNLEPYVALWLAERRRHGKSNLARYERELRLLIPEGRPFPRSQLTKAAVAAHLARYGHGTFNRYRTIFMAFAGYLVDEAVLADNPVRAVRRRPEPSPRVQWYAEADAERLVGWITSTDARVAEAIMAGTGMEWQAVERLTRADVDLKARRLHARGTKKPGRDRFVYVTEDWAWSIIEPHVRTIVAGRVVRISGRAVWKWHKRAAKALALEPSTLHDWRHSHAVWLRRRGVSDTVIACQLGHRDTTQVANVYGPATTSKATTARRIRDSEGQRPQRLRPRRLRRRELRVTFASCGRATAWQAAP